MSNSPFGIPDQQAAGFRPTPRPISERIEGEPGFIAKPPDAAEPENIIGHGYIVEDTLFVNVEPAPCKLDTLPFVAHKDAVEK